MTELEIRVQLPAVGRVLTEGYRHEVRQLRKCGELNLYYLFSSIHRSKKNRSERKNKCKNKNKNKNKNKSNVNKMCDTNQVGAIHLPVKMNLLERLRHPATKHVSSHNLQMAAGRRLTEPWLTKLEMKWQVLSARRQHRVYFLSRKHPEKAQVTTK